MARIAAKIRSKGRVGGGKASSGVGPRLAPVWSIAFPDGSRFGEDRIRLLGAIRETGSLLQAAAACGLSYRTAWNRVKELNGASAIPLVESVQGGAEGGASRLSPQAERLLALHQEAERLFRGAEAGVGLDPSESGSLVGFRRRLSMRTSIRNQLPCVVRSVETDSVSSEVGLELEGGAVVLARVTASSCLELGLAMGREAWVLVKAGKVLVSRHQPRSLGKMWNTLVGSVESVRRGAGSDEVLVRIEGGVEIVASAQDGGGPELERGERVFVTFDGKDVIVAVE